MNPHRPLALFAVALRAAEVAAADSSDLLGCWDDQFNGTASMHMRVTAETIVTLFDAYPPPAAHDIVGDLTSHFDTGNAQVDARGVSFVTRNGPANDYHPGLYSDFDMMLRSNGDGAADDVLYYCQIDFNATSAAEAAEEDEDVSYGDLASGCNGFPWSKMRRAEADDECKELMGDDEPSSAFATGPFATAAAVASVAIASMGIISL